jgi:hypothetical protein
MVDVTPLSERDTRQESHEVKKTWISTGPGFVGSRTSGTFPKEGRAFERLRRKWGAKVLAKPMYSLPSFVSGASITRSARGGGEAGSGYASLSKLAMATARGSAFAVSGNPVTDPRRRVVCRGNTSDSRRERWSRERAGRVPGSMKRNRM